MKKELTADSKIPTQNSRQGKITKNKKKRGENKNSKYFVVLKRKTYFESYLHEFDTFAPTQILTKEFYFRI